MRSLLKREEDEWDLADKGQACWWLAEHARGCVHVCTCAGSTCMCVCLNAWWVNVVAVPLLELPAWAVDGHQQVQGEEHRVHREHLLSISHNRRHLKKFTGLSLKETWGIVSHSPWVGWEITAICCYRYCSTNPHHGEAEQIQVIKRPNSDQMSLLEEPSRGGKGILGEGAQSRCSVGW